MVRDLMIQTGVLERRIAFEEYTDTRFAERSDGYNAWRFDPGDTVAH
jgi:NitT/TauT family transport system substrate-binding protein